MRLTPALYVRQLLAKLNPPFPRTVRESQQLLNVLESSFRKQLDETHPAPSQGAHIESNQRTIPLDSTDSSSIATQHYLNSLLTHPLLDSRARNRLAQPSHTKTAVERYQNAFIQGTITIDLLQKCLRDYCAGLRKRESIQQEDKLGPRLSAWLHSASPRLKQSFFVNQSLLDRALTVMAADDEERAVWDWLRMVYERATVIKDSSNEEIPDQRWLAVEDDLVSTLMRFSIRRKDLDDAAQQFAEACRYRSRSDMNVTAEISGPTPRRLTPMTSSWKRLAASVILTRGQHGISPERYDAALQYGSPWTKDPIFNEAVLAIYHPSAASAQLLCMNLRQPIFRSGFVKAIKESNKNMSLAILVAVLDGAQLSLKHNITSDARDLLDFASENYGEYVPVSQADQRRNLEQRIQSMLEILRPTQKRPGQLAFT